MSPVEFKKGCVALSNLRVKGPHGDLPVVGQAFDGKGESVRTLLINTVVARKSTQPHQLLHIVFTYTIPFLSTMPV